MRPASQGGSVIRMLLKKKELGKMAVVSKVCADDLRAAKTRVL